jgi:hypothetical protein
MSRHRRRRRRGDDAKRLVRRGVATGSTVTLASLGLSNCGNGGGVAVDPPPPPALVCADANQGQNLEAVGTVQDSTLTVNVFSSGYYQPVVVDTAYVTNVTGATLDSLSFGNWIQLNFTLDADTTSQVTFTVAGTFDLDAGPCDFTRTFTATINSGKVDVALRRLGLPLGINRDIRIELVQRTGLVVRLRAAGAAGRKVLWKVTGGAIERRENSGLVWRLPAEKGFYQVELCVDSREEGFGFDALSLEVT